MDVLSVNVLKVCAMGSDSSCLPLGACLFTHPFQKTLAHGLFLGGPQCQLWAGLPRHPLPEECC